MKTIYNYTFRIVCIYIFALTIFAITSIDLTTSKSNYKVENEVKELDSSILMQTTQKEEIQEIEPEEENTIEKIEEEKQVTESVDNITTNNTYIYVQPVDTSSYPVLQTASGNLSHYGHDCYGCTSGKTASGYDISSGNIYYTDPTFGSVRIVAAGNEYPLGTILRLTNVESTPIIAIVLDRGGAIGNGKKFTLDLLTESNDKAYELGVRYSIQIEMLRLGY